MREYLPTIIIGVYTIIYVLVFIIQKNQRDNDREIIKKMESFMKIFDIKKVEDYTKVYEKTLEMKYKLLLSDEQKLRDIAKEIVMAKNNEITEMNKKNLEDNYMELIKFALSTIMAIPKEERQNFIDTGLPRTKKLFYEMLLDVENKKI
jgi:vacuolar-type H+-ATPase subunit H